MNILELYKFLYMFLWFMTGLYACEFHYNSFLKKHKIINDTLFNGKNVYYKYNLLLTNNI